MPVSVLGNWQLELQRFAPAAKGARTSWLVDSPAMHEVRHARQAPDVCSPPTHSLRAISSTRNVRWSRLVLDEAQQIKNPGTAQTRAVQRLHAARRIAMTGTPIENRLSELWSIMHVLNPGLLGTQRGFRERFAIPIEREHDAASADQLKRITAHSYSGRKTDRRSRDLPKDEGRSTATTAAATLYQASSTSGPRRFRGRGTAGADACSPADAPKAGLQSSARSYEMDRRSRPIRQRHR